MFKFTVRGDASSLAARAGHSLSAAGRCLPAATVFASVGLVAASTAERATAAAAPLSVKEKRTGVEFSGEFCYFDGQSDCPRLAGTGARTKRIAGIKNLDIYALALYVDEAAVSSSSSFGSKFASKAPEQVAKDQQLFEDLMSADNVEKSIVIEITSKMAKRKAFLDALNERLAPPMTKAKEDAALEAFKCQFDAVSFRKGLRITFTFKDGNLVTKADGQELSRVRNERLARSLMDIYVGKDAVSPGAKKEFGAGLARMILA